MNQSSVQITPGSRVGMVGRNGTGKSTLFKVIRGEFAAEHGTVSLPPRWRVGSLAQEAPNGPESLISVVLKADLERDALLTEAESATDPHQIAEIQTRLVDIDAHSAPSRAAAILSGLGFSAADQLRPCAEFSGGWRMRVALAATLFAAPDLLLLDEPTNYLDLEGTLWLEDHLAHYPRTVIVISHDRDLLESSVDQILHLDRSKLTLYKGTYSSFEEQRAMREMLDAKAVKRQEAERARLQAFVDRFKAKASKARQAQSRVKMLERLKPITALVTQDVHEISFPAPEKILSPPIIAADNVVVGYDPNSPVLNRVTLRVDNDDRIALLGSNGNGKSDSREAARRPPRAVLGQGDPRRQALDCLFRPAPARRIERGCLDLRPRPQAYGRGARSQSTRPRRCDRLFRQGGRYQGRKIVGRREGAAPAGTGDLLRPQHDHPGRADQPSRHRQPRRACGSHQRILRRRHHGFA
ncbi:ATPase subunit of ABC transporter with duplicated ATPase domains [Bradyrhizobium sp. GM22.5]